MPYFPLNRGAGGEPSPPPPHASTHHLNGADAISAEAIGAEVEGTAQSLIISHINEPNPHPQYRRQGVGISWSDIIKAPSFVSPPILNFTPFTDGTWIVINGLLPQLLTISDPPTGNEGLPCWLATSGSSCRQQLIALPSGSPIYRITAFGRSFSQSPLTLNLAFFRIRAGDNAVIENPANSLTMTNQWQQFDFNVTNLNTTNTQFVALRFAVSGPTGQPCQIYGPQLSTPL